MTLTHPWFLLGLLSLAVPVLLHLFELRRPQRVLFTNVEFIREVKLLTAKQRRLQHLLVLALRLGFLTLLVLLFCQPFIPAPHQSTHADVEANVVMDDSPSMAVETGSGKPMLEQSVNEMQRIVHAFPKTAQYRLWAGRTPQASLSANKLVEELSQLNPSAASAGVRTTLRQLENRGGNAKQTTFVTSDFQKSSFAAADIQGLRSAGEVFLLPLTTRATANAYVDSVFLTEEFVRTGVDLPLHIRLRNGGAKEATQVQVRVFIGPRQVATYTSNVAAGNTVENIVRIRLAEAQTQFGRVELEEQPVTYDNTYYFTLKPSGRIRVVDVSSGGTATQKLYPNEAVFAYSPLRPESSPGTLEGADLLIVQGNSRLTPGWQSAAAKFVERGGTLVVIPPSAAGLRAGYDQLWASLGLTSMRWATGSTAQELAVPNQQNPFFKDVFAQQTRQPDMPRATPVLSWGRSTTDVLQFRDGQPFLSGFRSGQGMVYVFASPLQAGLSTFAEHPLFVPVMYRLATLSKSSEQLPAYRLTNRAVVLRPLGAPTSGAEQVYKLRNDSNSYVPAQQLRNGRLYLQLPAPMRQPGYYQLTLNDKVLTTLAFNVDKKESELAQYSAEELRQLTAAYPNVHVYEAGGERSAAQQLAEERNGTPLWRYCLVGALLCLLGEVLVLRFGQRRERLEPQAA
ncbi:BatA domain-containing protein [Hymenobacter sp. 15J16-1T3B]|uniref:BatA domain-containing protein n=1 Tax=Hymenobacter sp. 15J16-1T3B TaxID=2886941 RepID=UPI001D118DFA|nr:BatA domain-containing protein [Hymenobacter sp. 15J16-1T3B]MCC3160507.1 BatA domain-containing protein [Hymenobacter sp. 15J16-1T3B]